MQASSVVIRSTTLAAKYRRDSSDQRSDTFSHKLCSRRFFGYLISCGSGLFYPGKPFEHKITAEAGAVGPFVNFPSLRVLLFPRETDPFMAEARAMCENKFAQLVFFFASDIESSFSGVEWFLAIIYMKFSEPNLLLYSCGPRHVHLWFLNRL